MNIGEKIKQIRLERGLTQEELAVKLGFKHKTSISKIESNQRNLTQSKIQAIASVLGVSPSDLLLDCDDIDASSAMESPYLLPIYNSAAAGFNVLAQDAIVGYSPANIQSEIEQYIYVNVVGDSMSPLIDDGSKILVKKQESVDSGQIAVVLIDGEEAVVKRVVYGTDWIELQSVNPYYPPRRFSGADVQRIRVIGLVKEVIKTLA